MKELALKIRLVDEVSSAMNNKGDSGTKVIAGLENGFVNVSSEISHTSKAAAGSIGVYCKAFRRRY